MSRSRPGAERQAADLQQAGHEVVVAPVIDVQPLAVVPPAGPFDLVIFLSEHGVRLGWPALGQQRWMRAATVLAVGSRTAAVLAERGVTALVPGRPTSEGLLELPALASLARRRVLLVTGRGGRALLDTALHDHGADVQRFECYRRVAVDALPATVRDCDAIIAASGEGLAQAARLWLAAGGDVRVAVLVPSARVARLGVELGLSNLHDCGGADSEAWLRGLATLQSREGHD